MRLFPSKTKIEKKSITSDKLADGAVVNQVIEDEGVPVRARGTINFTGAGVSVSDTDGKTTVAIAGGSALSDGDYGDITVGGGGTTLTIDNDAVTYAKMQDASGACFIGATGAGALSERTYANVRSDLGLVIGTNVQAYDAQLSSLAALSYSGNSLKVVRVNAGETDFELATPATGGEAFPVGAVYINVTGVNPGTELGYGTWSAFGAGRVMVGYDSGDTDFDAAEETGGAKTKAISAHAGTAVADHASHTHTYSEVPNHTHPVNITDPGHAHTMNLSATDGAAGKADASSGGTAYNNVSGIVNSNTTGITATTSNPSGGVATGTTNGPSSTLTHTVTQPSDHTALNVVQPYIVAHFWKRTA